MRSLNQWQYLITVGAGGEYSFKPRFVLKDGRLTRVEMPQLDYGSYVICARDPAACLQEDEFLPDGPSGPVRKTFPYSAALFRLFTGTRVAGYLSGRASWERFLEPGHDGAALTKAMLRRFRDVARSRGQVPLVVIFPTVGSARIYANEARIATAPISEAAAALGLGVVDLHQPIHRRSGGDICSVLVSAERCGGHFNARGNAIIAETLETPLRKRLSGPDGGRR